MLNCVLSIVLIICLHLFWAMQVLKLALILVLALIQVLEPVLLNLLFVF